MYLYMECAFCKLFSILLLLFSVCFSLNCKQKQVTKQLWSRFVTFCVVSVVAVSCANNFNYNWMNNFCIFVKRYTKINLETNPPNPACSSETGIFKLIKIVVFIHISIYILKFYWVYQKNTNAFIFSFFQKSTLIFFSILLKVHRFAKVANNKWLNGSFLLFCTILS